MARSVVMHCYELSILKDANGSLSERRVEHIKNLTGAGCFIETGTYLGNTTHAMRAIFDQVVSIELSQELHAAAVNRFKHDEKVTLLQGDSAEKIREALGYAGSNRAIVWLDAHWSGGNTAKADGNTPILAELQGIGHAGITDAVILIDDVSYFWSVRPGFNVHDSIGGYPEVEMLIDELMRLNSEFVIFVNADVMFAIPQSLMNGVAISPVLEATSRLRIGLFNQAELPQLERIVANAQGGELEAILQLPDVFSHALSYGIGGHFCHWRGLVNERCGRNTDAKRDFDLARDCGVSIARRSWEW
jgi:hypothetical protein